MVVKGVLQVPGCTGCASGVNHFGGCYRVPGEHKCAMCHWHRGRVCSLAGAAVFNAPAPPAPPVASVAAPVAALVAAPVAAPVVAPAVASRVAPPAESSSSPPGVQGSWSPSGTPYADRIAIPLAALSRELLAVHFLLDGNTDRQSQRASRILRLAIMHAGAMIDANNADPTSGQGLPVLPELTDRSPHIGATETLAREVAAFVLQEHVFDPANFQLTGEEREAWLSGLEIPGGETHLAGIVNLFRFVTTSRSARERYRAMGVRFPRGPHN